MCVGEILRLVVLLELAPELSLRARTQYERLHFWLRISISEAKWIISFYDLEARLNLDNISPNHLAEVSRRRQAHIAEDPQWFIREMRNIWQWRIYNRNECSFDRTTSSSSSHRKLHFAMSMSCLLKRDRTFTVATTNTEDMVVPIHIRFLLKRQ